MAGSLRIERGQLRAVVAFDEHAHGAIRQLEQLENRGDNARFIKIVAIGIVTARIELRQQEDVFRTGHGHFERGHRLFAANEQRHDHAGENHDVAQGKQGIQSHKCKCPSRLPHMNPNRQGLP